MISLLLKQNFFLYFTTVFSFYLGSPYETNAKRDRGCIIIWEIDVQNWQQETVVPRRLLQDGKQQKAAYDHIPIVKEEALTFNAISVCAMNVVVFMWK